jgi:tetratricopeptide (TPR) repeat protein
VSTGSDDRDRQVIPRWRSLVKTIANGELRPVKVRGPLDLNMNAALGALTIDWSRHQTPSFASDLVGVAQSIGAWGVADDAARCLLESESATAAQRALARRYLQPTSPEARPFAPIANASFDEDARQRIADSRLIIKRDPRNAIAWTELARSHAALGRTRGARAEMLTAVHLAPENRFVLRGASALFVHIGEPDMAHTLVSHAGDVSQDPWLLATEIATSSAAGRTSRLVKRASVLLDRQFPAIHVTELASALGTLELHAGDIKRARNLFRTSIIAANDNSIAQAEWASRRVKGIAPAADVLDAPLAYEARARRDVEEGAWKSAVQNSWYWHYDQPFTSAPAIFGSHAAAIGLRDFEEAARIAEAGLVASPDEAMLLNNYAFALLQLDHVKQATEALRRIPTSAVGRDIAPVITATRGLLAFRQGDPDKGRAMYQQAIAMAKRSGARDIAALAEVILAREELRTRGASVIAEVLRVIREVESASGLGIREWVVYLAEDIERVREQPDGRTAAVER